MTQQYNDCFDYFHNTIYENDIDNPVELSEEIFTLLCDELAVVDVHEHTYLMDNKPVLENWYAFMNTEGIIAYFGDEDEACNYRLDYMRRILNDLFRMGKIDKVTLSATNVRIEHLRMKV